MSTIDIVDWSDESGDTFAVTVDNYEIKTTVTSSPDVVSSWIANIEYIHRRRLHCLVIGLDVEWRPNFSRHISNPVATLQLCVGRICLIYQLIYTPYIPRPLLDFLYDPNYAFVGVGIETDVEKLLADYQIGVQNVVDLGGLASARCGLRSNAGLKELARDVVGLEVEKPRRVTLSRWDVECLSYEQIQYAAVDAFLSFEIGMRLRSVRGN